jgi:uncharacterized GH25 family protein
MRLLLALAMFALSSPLSAAMRGTVYDADGRPLANVKVTAVRSESSEQELARALASAPEPEALATASTDDTGAFQLDVAGLTVVSLGAVADAYLPWRSIERTDDGEIVISLERARMRTGHVRSAGGPVKDALVVFTGERTEVLDVQRTDERGAYSAPDNIGWASTMCVVHRSFAPSCQDGVTAAGRAPLTVMLEPGRRISGKVVDSGKPVANATIYAGGFPLGRTSENGTFSFADAPVKGGVRAVLGTKIGTAPAAADMTIALAEGHAIQGAVRDGKGRPISGVVVATTAQSTEPAIGWSGATTDAKGEYRIPALTPDRYIVWVLGPASWKFAQAELEVRRSGTSRRDFVIEEEQAIRGTVLDESRKPVAGAAVIMFGDQVPVFYGRMAGPMPSTRTNAQGRFRMTVETPDGTRLVVLKPGYAAGTSAKFTEATRSKPLTITLPAGVEVTGTVVDKEGNAQSGVAIVAAEATQMLNAMPLGAAVAAGVLTEWTRSDAEGKFSIRLNAAPHDISAWKSGFASSDNGAVAIRAGMDPLRIVLQPAVEIRGRVTRKGGAALTSGVVAAMRADNSGGAQTTIEGDGSFVLGSLTAGTYMVMVQTEEGSITQTVDAPARDVVLELAGRIPVRGRVIDASSGAPVTSFKVNTSNFEAMYQEESDISDATGTFSVNAPAGPMEIAISSPGYARVERNVIVADESAQPLEFALVRGRRIFGRITSDGGQLENAYVSASSDDQSGETAMADEEGKYEFEGAPVSDFEIEIRAERHLTSKVKVPAGSEDHRLDVTLSSGRKLVGRVVDVSGRGVADVHVRAWSEAHGAEGQNTTTGADGTFTLGGLIDAHYDIHANKGASKGTLEDVNVTAVQNVTVRLAVQSTAVIHGTVAGAAKGNWMFGMVQASSKDGSGMAQVQRDGTYRIEDAPSGEVSVRVTFMSADREMTTPAVRVQIPEGATVEVNITPEPGLQVRGRVTADGQPVASSFVSFTNDHGRWRATTSADGSYEVSGLEPGSYSVQVGSFQKQDYSTTYEVTGPSTFDITISRATLRGQVVDSAGAPVSAATVTITSSQPQGSRANSTTTDASGSFTAVVQDDEAYTVSASRKGFIDGSARVEKGAAANPILIRLTKGAGQAVRLVDARTGATLSGYVVVTDESGKAQIPVTAQNQSDGSLHLPLPDGRYRIAASAGDYASATIRISVPSAEVRMALLPGGTLIVNAPTEARHLVRLVQPNGDEYVRCYCNGIAEIRLEGATTKVEHVAAGAYRMDLLDSAGSVVRSYPVTIVEGQTVTVDATR